MKKKTIDQVADLVHDASAKTLERLTCPRCGGSIDLQYVPSSRPRRKWVGSIFTMCKQCMWRVISDGVSAEPPWVRELGCKVQTGKKLKPSRVASTIQHSRNS